MIFEIKKETGDSSDTSGSEARRWNAEILSQGIGFM